MATTIADIQTYNKISTTHTNQVHERLSGDMVFDESGNPAEPSSALPYYPTSPVPTMLVPREQSYLHWLASRLSGTGRIVELGCFLGGSTSALAAGASRNTNATQPMLTYDSFEIPRECPAAYIVLLQSYGLEPGTSFLERFKQCNKKWLDQVLVREGWLPENASRAQEHDIYPEQDPIELLFVDIAKTWDVHRTVLRTFARHMHTDAIMVQQDFFDLQTPWIPLHMWQLRDVLEPLDAIHGTPSMSFRCVGDISSKLDTLWAESHLVDRDVRRDIWDRVHGYWSNILGTKRAGFLYGHAAMHAIYSGDGDEAARNGRMFDAWSRSAESKGVYFSPCWPDIVTQMPEDLASRGCDSQDAMLLSVECAVRGARAEPYSDGNRTAYYSDRQRHSLWSNAIDRIRDDGHRKIAIFGAGRHTHWLLSENIIGEDIEVSCIIDDAPSIDSIACIPVANPENAEGLLDGVTAVVPSSDSMEARLVTRIHELYSSETKLDVYTVYKDASATIYVTPNSKYIVRPAPRIHARDDEGQFLDFPTDLDERVQLGLPSHRPWAQTLRDYYTIPEWTTECIKEHEAAFLWDMIEASRPQRIVEIGTASGVSTAILLAGAKCFCHHDAEVCSFDIATSCYFDENRSLGAAIGEMVPELLLMAHMYERSDAIDAAMRFQIGEVDLAFIDGNHAHPAPTMDLFSLLYALRPGAWVVLHDIELANITQSNTPSAWKHTTGAERLFTSWPYEKVQLSGSVPERRNIGAIRMPEDLAEVVPYLLDLLKQPWEMSMGLGDQAMAALDGMQ